MRALQISLIVISLLYSSSCEKTPDAEYDFIGKWQSLNSNKVAICIDSLHHYDLQIEGTSLFSDLADYEKIKIEIAPLSGKWSKFELRDVTGKEFSKGKIEVVDPSRIRIYHHKHNDILDEADEYYRIVGNESFDEIMCKLMN